VSTVALALVLVLTGGVLAVRSVSGGELPAASPFAGLKAGTGANSSGAAPQPTAATGAPVPVGTAGGASAAPGAAVPRSPASVRGNQAGRGLVLFATGRAESGQRGTDPALTVLTAAADGSRRSPRPAAPPYPLDQVSGELVVTTQRLGSPGPSASPEQGIALLDTRTGRTRVVTRGGFDDAPAWSPDGRVLAYRSRIQDPDGTQRNVVRLRSRGGRELGTVQGPPKGQSDAPPVWAPDGTAIATVRTLATAQGPRSHVVVLPLDGSAPIVLAQGEYSDLAWSPDRGTIAAVRRYGGTRADIWIIDVAGRGAKRITSFGPEGNGIARTNFCGQSGRVVPRVAEPVWSRDGRGLAYLNSYPHAREFARQADVQVVDVASKVVTTAYGTPRASCRDGQPRFTRTQLYGWLP
jgi:Tol biopolymer transport system component